MRIILHDFGGYPFIRELALELSNCHKVYFYYSSNSQSPNSSQIFVSSTSSYFEKNISVFNFAKKNYFLRFFGELIYGIKLVYIIAKNKPAVIFSSNTPLITQLMLLVYSKISKIRFVFWLQDIISIAIKNILSKKNSSIGFFIGGLFMYIEKYILHQSDKIIVISPHFFKQLMVWGIKQENVMLIENWASNSLISNISKINAFALEHAVSQTFNIIYSGTLGEKHNPDIFLKLSKYYLGVSHVRIIIISEGKIVDKLKSIAEVDDLVNIVFLPFQPYDKLASIYASADLLFALLEPMASQFSVPSKVYSYIAAGKPILLVAPPDNLAAEIIINNNLGFVSDNNYLNIIAFIDSLIASKDLVESFSFNSNKYAKEHFNISNILTKFNKIINEY